MQPGPGYFTRLNAALQFSTPSRVTVVYKCFLNQQQLTCKKITELFIPPPFIDPCFLSAQRCVLIPGCAQMAPEGGIAAVLSYLHITVEAPGCAGPWFCAAEPSLLLRTQMDPPGQEVTDFPLFSPASILCPFPPLIWFLNRLGRSSSAEAWGNCSVNWVSPNQHLGLMGQAACPGKNALAEKIWGWGRAEKSPAQLLSPGALPSISHPEHLQQEQGFSTALHWGCTSYQALGKELCSHCWGCTEQLGEAGKEQGLAWPPTLRSGHSNQKWR